MMNILLVNTHHFRGGGDSTYTFNLADLLQSKGHQVAFFAMQNARNLPDPNADLFVSHIDFRELDQRKGLATGLKVLRRVIYSREARSKFSAMLVRFQPDVVHLQNIHAHITPSVIFEAKARGLPVIWTLHDYKQICPNSHLLIDATHGICEACGQGAYYQAILKRCKKNSFLASSMVALEAYVHRLMRVRERIDMFLSPSTFLRRKLVERGFPPEKVSHLPLFLPEDLFCDAKGGDEGCYILSFGRLDPIKGIYPLLQACRMVPEVQLILAGRATEPLASQLPALLPPNVRYVGMKHGEELRRLLQEALAAVVPSLWYENQPFSILEAFACGKPVIASDLGGMTELVKHKERGLLVTPGNAQDLAAAMRWVLAHAAEAKEMGCSAQRYASQEHSVERHYERIMQTYEQAVRRV